MATKGSIVYTAILAWTTTLTAFFTTGSFFSPYGVIIFLICSIAITFGGVYYYKTTILKRENQYPKPFKPITSKMVKTKRVFFTLFTSIESFEGILSLLVVYFGFQFLIDIPANLIDATVLSQLQISFTILAIVGILLLIDGVRRFWKEVIKTRY